MVTQRGLRLTQAALAAIALLAACRGAFGSQILLKDGRTLAGKLGMVSGMAELAQATHADGSGALQTILLLDDDLRRTFVSKRLVQKFSQEEGVEIPVKIAIQQRVLRMGPSVRAVGPAARLTPFDEYGRRIFTMFTAKGMVDVVQGITLITPTWTKVEGLTHTWDMRIATSSLPRDILAKILAKQGDLKNLDFRRKVAQFYLQSERYEEASQELEALLAQSPDDATLKEDLAPALRKLKEFRAKQMLSELRLRREAGQHELVLAQLKKFPSEAAPGVELQTVREMIQEYESLASQRAGLFKRLAELFKKIGNEQVRQQLAPVLKEMAAELNLNTLDRLSAFRQMQGDESLPPDDRVSLAVSAWLLGPKDATPKLDTALSLIRTRRLIRQYLTTPDKLGRAKILDELPAYGAGAAGHVAKLLAQMNPPVETPEPDNAAHCYDLEVPAVGNSPSVRYLVSLPPEYDPHRRYPTILTLHGENVSPERQIDWWAGPWSDKAGMRLGQAARHGYIVVAPEWTSDHQKRYQYSAREHGAMLNALRDACRRFSIDTDRVFLSGHSMGGDAAWDMGLAHPDLWAGVIPIAAMADKYCSLYWENAESVPFYFVGGELDGARMVRNARDLDRYLKRGYSATVVEYLGRGHEDFSDEILRLFDWMGRMRRNFFPKKFSVSTMRAWDNFFWWVELNQLPAKAQVAPENWPPPRGTLPVQTEASVTASNAIFVKTGAAQLTIWLSPEMLDLGKRINLTVNGARVNLRGGQADPKVETILEDARTRGDRAHPFWVKLEPNTGRIDSSGR